MLWRARPSTLGIVVTTSYESSMSWRGESRVIISFSLEQGLPYTYEPQEQLYRRILRTIRPARVFARVLPNTRLKLAAPFCCGGLPFVKSSTSRRSLSAFR